VPIFNERRRAPKAIFWLITEYEFMAFRVRGLHQHDFVDYSSPMALFWWGVTQTEFKNGFGVPGNPPPDVSSAVIL